MPCFIRQLTPTGLQPVAYSADSLVDAAQYEPQGVYTITNTYPNLQALKLDAHLARLEDSARRDDIAITLDRAGLRAALRQVIIDSGWNVIRFRITIPRATPEQPILSVEPFQPPAPEVYAHGIRCMTVTDARRDNPAAKTTGWMTARKSAQAAFPPGVTEGILVSGTGALLEGLSSNFYAILDDVLRTADEGVLPGIGRQVVYEVAPDIVPLVLKPVQQDDLPQLQEAFITSASRGIVPVVEIDGVALGDGTPGPTTQALGAVYKAWVVAHLEDI